jgi:hypothetical protein
MVVAIPVEGLRSGEGFSRRGKKTGENPGQPGPPMLEVTYNFINMNGQRIFPKRAIYALVFFQTFATALSAQEKPNFIFVYTDDQRYDCLAVV